MGGLDALVFTGGIGQGSAGVRSLACQGLACMGIRVSEEKNRSAKGFTEICEISDNQAGVTALVIPTDEELMIARATLRTLDRNQITRIVRSRQKAPVPIEISAHHVHLSREHVDILFGPGYELTPDVNLSQPGQFACKEKVNLIGPKSRIDRVRILGPPRKETQIEISMTEQFILGLQPPIRQSGDLVGTPGITLEGPKGTVTTDSGVICAFRHIHMAPEDALRYGLRDKCLVTVRTVGGRKLIFGDVLVRVHPNYRLTMHIDTDEANAAQIGSGAVGYIDEVQSKAA
jgi:acetate kinase